VISKKTLKWVFVGGKGGVGKTTCSCSVALLLAKVRPSVLIISTDPAHNLSDAFGQKFTKEPTLVNGFKNLWAMEIDPTFEPEDEHSSSAAAAGLGGTMMQELAGSIPGVDEAMSFAEVMKLVQSMEFSVVVFDTAPTGHTLRLLSFPSMLSKSLSRFSGLNNRFAPLFQQFSSMMGGAGAGDSEESVQSRLDVTRQIIEQINTQFKNPTSPHSCASAFQSFCRCTKPND